MVGTVWRGLRRGSKNGITNVAAALAYYAFLAIPSALLVTLGVFSLVAGPGDVRSLLTHLDGIVPQSAIALIEDSLVRTTGASSGGLVMVVAGAVLAVWTLTGAMTTLMWALNIAFGREEDRGFIRQRLTALKMLGLAVVAVTLAFVLLVLGPPLSTWIGDAIGQPSAVSWVWWIAEWPILLVGLFGAFAGMLYLGPAGEQPHGRFVSAGGVVAVAIWLGASGAFAFYASRFGSYNKAWGSIAAVIVMLTWLWISSLALLIGAEIEAEALRGSQAQPTEAAQETARPTHPPSGLAPVSGGTSYQPATDGVDAMSYVPEPPVPHPGPPGTGDPQPPNPLPPTPGDPAPDPQPPNPGPPAPIPGPETPEPRPI